MASTCSTEVTLGSVVTKRSSTAASPAASTSAATKIPSVRTPRRRVGASRLLQRMPANGGAWSPASSAASVRAPSVAAASSVASSRTP